MKREMFLLWIPLIFIVFILAIGLLSHFGISVFPFSQEICGCQYRIPDHYYLIFGIALVLTSIPICYYYISNRLEKKLNEYIESLFGILNKRKNKTNQSELSREKKILKFLNSSEQKIVQILLKNNGEILQSQISKSGDMTKLQVHRTVKSLEQKNILGAESYGKTKKLSLNKKFRTLL